jgi:hypothetical protein
MKSVTIHGIDSELDKKITEKAKEFGLSQNRTVKKLLESSLSLEDKEAKKAEYSELFASWTVAEKADFDTAVKDFEKINETDWK